MTARTSYTERLGWWLLSMAATEMVLIAIWGVPRW